MSSRAGADIVGVIAFPAMRFCLCLLALAALSGQARAAPPVPKPASGFLAPFAIPVAQREERLVPPMPIPHVERKSPPLPRSRPAPRNTAADGSPRNRSDRPGSTSSVNSGCVAYRTVAGECFSQKVSRDSRHRRLIVRDRVLSAGHAIAIQKLALRLRRAAVERAVAMREPSEFLDDIPMLPRVAQLLRIAQRLV
jgi:hypothetical protein